MRHLYNRWPLVAIPLAVLAGGMILASLYTSWLWFRVLEYQSVFWRVMGARLVSGVLFGALAALVLGVNLAAARRFTRHVLHVVGSPWGATGAPSDAFLRSRALYWVVGGALVLMLARIGSGQWLLWLRYTHSQAFGVADPIFGRDIGFYVFALPFLRFTASFLLGGVILSVVAVGAVYMAGGGIRFQERIDVLPQPRAHLLSLGGVFLLVMSWVYRLKIWGLLYSEDWVAFGAGYVDVHVQVWTYWLLVGLYLIAAGLLFAGIHFRDRRTPLVGGLLVGVAILVGFVPSTLTQTLVVDPSELAREAPYIQHNIDATRRAYGLDRIEEQPFAADQNLTRADIEANPLTIRNIRVWDERPLAQTYQQVQEIRPYYVFSGVDVDRYTVDGVYRQVMLSAREMAADRLPAQARSWVNERLQYTHGYGIAMSPVNHVTADGLPDLIVRDIPPIAEPGLEISRPEIYYGERTYAYVAVNTSTQEFDYPRGDENAFSTYEGTGGVPLGGLLGRLAFALRFTDLNLILSNYITADSRIMFRRQISARVNALAPFLQFDSDPYMVVSGGKLYWVMDAYTTTDMYPYSTRGGRARINYIRNSVKAVVDAYNGTVTFYRMDLDEPLATAYAEIFPGMLRPLDQMPADLRQHLRYPKDMFKYQAMIYRSYHMHDVQVFYNQEDLWEIPNEIYRDSPQLMEPYYIIVRLPGEEREEFMLMVPFTPARKDNMIGWLAARCDGDNYGDLLVYQLPKDRMIFGPMQLEARIDQQPEISSQLTLWGQKGSEVIRGNLLAIPVEQSFLYVEPIYLQARQEAGGPAYGPGPPQAAPGQRQLPLRPGRRSTAIPELKQVIVAYGGQVVMRSTLEEALYELFGAGTVAETADLVPGAAQSARQLAPVELALRTAAQMAAEAEEHYQRAQAALQEWDWTRAGEEMAALKQRLSELREALGTEP
ncbi:UPF0182 family protein [Candidatus Latescibacterota bacterium]